MTEKQLRNTYGNVSLSEERLDKLEKKLMKRFENNSGVLDDEFIRLSQTGEKPMKSSRRKYIISACSAAAAVVILASVITLAYNSGMFRKIETVSDDTSQTSVSTPDTDTSLLNPNDFIITKSMLPDYPNKGEYDFTGGSRDVDETSFYAKCADDLKNKLISSTVLIAEFTVTSCAADPNNDRTVYDVTVGTTYYSTLGIDTEGRSIKLTMDGCAGGKILTGCPPYYEGDRIIAAVSYGSSSYTLSAAYTLADIVTVNGTDFAAIRSSQLSNLFIKNYANGDTIDYVTTDTLNPVTYYAVYEKNEYGSYLASKKNATETSDTVLEGSFDAAALKFRHDSSAMTLFEETFSGYWSDVTFGYTNVDDIFSSRNNSTFFGGIAEDDSAFYLKRRIRGTDTSDVYAVMKNSPEVMYLYETDCSGAVPRAEYSERFWKGESANSISWLHDSQFGYFSGSPDAQSGAVVCNQLGMAKKLAEYSDDDLYNMFFNLLENGSTEYNGKTWNRVNAGYKSFGSRNEKIILNSAQPDRLVVSIRMYDAAAADYTPDIGEEFNAENSARYFRAEFTKQNGKFTYTLTPCSGETTDLQNFFSPLESIENYPITAEVNAEIDRIDVEYYPVERNGTTEIYALRKLGSAENAPCEIYYRDPACDEYVHICDGYEPALLTTFDGTVYCFSNGKDKSSVSRIIGGYIAASGSIDNVLSGGAQLYESGAYLIAMANGNSENKWVVFDKFSLNTPEIFRDNELRFTDDGFVTEKDGKAVLRDKAGQNFDGILPSLLSRYNFTWESLMTKSMYVTDKSEEYDFRSEWGTFCEPADPEWRSRPHLLNSLKENYTDKAAENALEKILVNGTAVYEQGSVIYAKKSDNFNELNGKVTLESAELSADGNSAVLNLKIEYKCMTYLYGNGEYDPNFEYYSINAVKTENGWRLDNFYSPISDTDFSKCT